MVMMVMMDNAYNTDKDAEDNKDKVVKMKHGCDNCDMC